MNVRGRLLAFALAAVAAIAFAPTGADAKIIELGETETQPKPSCPRTEEAECRAVSRTTGYQNRVGTLEDLFVVPRDGRIVAWTVILGDPTKKEINFFNAGFGGEPSAAITVLEKAEKNTTDQRAVAVSGTRVLTDYLGKKVQFPLIKSLPVLKGQRVALTVPTWAPVLAFGFPGNVAWRASRASANEGCDDFSSQTAMTMLGQTRPFQCYYKTARLTYTATLVTEPRPNKEARKRARQEEKESGNASSARVLRGASGA